MKLQDALDAFLLQLDADGRSIHTRRQYERHIRLFGDWLRDAGASDDVTAIDHQTIARFFGAPKAQRRADGGIRKATSANALRSSLRTLFAYLHSAGSITQNPTRLLRRAMCGTPLPKTLSPDEQERLVATIAAAADAEAKRDGVLVGLLLGAGLRIGSALALDTTDIDLDRAEIRLRSAKGNREQRVPLAAKVLDALRAHLTGMTPGPVFRAADGERITTRHAQRRVTHWATAAGIARAVSPHRLRHSFATGLYAKTRDLYVVQRALGHARIDTTTIYATMDDARLRTALEA